MLDLEDIQGIIVRGYSNLPAACFCLLEIRDAAAARAWLGQAAAQVTTGKDHPTRSATNLAITASGLARLGLTAEVFGQFSNEFRTGMTELHRQRILGDSEESAPENWAWGGPRTSQVDVLAMLYAADNAILEERFRDLTSRFQTGGLNLLLRLDTSDLHGFEHFGFRDGISQPLIEGLPLADGADAPVKAGEFLLGYANMYGKFTERPLVASQDDPRSVLPPDAEGSGRRDLGRNGSYLVYRQLAQNVPRFWQFVEGAAREMGVDPTWLAARMVGRWPGGAPLALSPDRDDPLLAQENGFGYYWQDAAGLRCPVASHVRRANPRDSLDPQPGTDGSIEVTNHHRILRRGREYGPALPVEEALRANPADAGERGLHFLCFNANLSRQFEFVQFTWLNSAKFDDLYNDADPVVGARRPGPITGATFTIPMEPVRRRVCGVPRFVTVRGGAYFFVPGIRALHYLASSGGASSV